MAEKPWEISDAFLKCVALSKQFPFQDMESIIHFCNRGINQTERILQRLNEAELALEGSGRMLPFKHSPLPLDEATKWPAEDQSG